MPLQLEYATIDGWLQCNLVFLEQNNIGIRMILTVLITVSSGSTRKQEFALFKKTLQKMSNFWYL